MLDLPIPNDMDGHMLQDIFNPDYLRSHTLKQEIVDGSLDTTQNKQLSETDEQDLTERLKGLGYL
jgi:hypothetical protein